MYYRSMETTMSDQEFQKGRYIPKGAKWDPMFREEFLYRLTFPTKYKRFPAFTVYHATVEEALTEAARVRALLPSWGERDHEPMVFLNHEQIFPTRGR
jgi:hypothetical protein